ncbi:MAG TPA: twin-arginine translocation signal domain-containing protein [Paraburkholderia sp.]|uniref:twin-arginine translocation signal domain-containing protein n=1 Tax=Paraburkholderia sp. TaxID=1926495 RepID=UPI002B4704D2|nr:twin-arginine translocation signal domain-containing protein [Paraburkholderia sp.]HKR45759.1 twin-arginine translocation signal domain-containing protein [Paraburkholderia sp.]
MNPTIIPITADPHGHAIDGAMRIKLTRRELLKGTGVLTGTLVLSSTLAMFAPSRVWALELQGLDTHQGDVLLAFTRHLYPHATLDNAVYALVVKDLDGKAQKDPAVRKQLADGVKQLDATAGGSDWSKRDSAAQARDVAALAGTPFFTTVRSTAIVSLYSNTLAYHHFGYGASEGDGGYLYKGFNNLSWLPNPPADESGPLPKDS